MELRTIKVVSHELARRIVADVTTRAAEHGAGVSVAVVDPSGVLVAFERMDGAPAFSAGLAVAKATTAATFGRPTADMEQDLGNRLGFTTSFVNHGGWYLGRGGAPIRADGATVGGLGVSGNTAELEDELARACARLPAG